MSFGGLTNFVSGSLLQSVSAKHGSPSTIFHGLNRFPEMYYAVLPFVSCSHTVWIVSAPQQRDIVQKSGAAPSLFEMVP